MRCENISIPNSTQLASWLGSRCSEMSKNVISSDLEWFSEYGKGKQEMKKFVIAPLV